MLQPTFAFHDVYIIETFFTVVVAFFYLKFCEQWQRDLWFFKKVDNEGNFPGAIFLRKKIKDYKFSYNVVCFMNYALSY